MFGGRHILPEAPAGTLYRAKCLCKCRDKDSGNHGNQRKSNHHKRKYPRHTKICPKVFHGIMDFTVIVRLVGRSEMVGRPTQ